MANNDKLRAVAVEYTTNGYNKVNALKKAGYKTNYAEHGGLKLFDNVRLKDMIAECEAKKVVMSTYDRQTHINHLDKLLVALQPKVDEGNVQAIRTATQVLSELAASTGLHSQTINTDAEQIAEIDENKKVEAKQLALIRLQETA